MKSKFISSILAIAVVLAMVSVPVVVPGVALASGNVTVAIEPATTHVLPNGSFTINVTVNNPSAMPIAMHQFCLNFNPTYFNVTSVAQGDTFTSQMSDPNINNTTGTVDWQPCMPTGKCTTAVHIVSAIISCTAKAAVGVSTVDYVYNTSQARLTKVTYGVGTEYLEGGNMSLMLSGTVIIGSPKLTVDVNPGLKGDVKINGATPGSYPNTTSWGWGANVTLQAIPVAGWAFVNWTGDLTGSTNPTSITMNSLTKNVTANFAELAPAIGLSPTSLSFVTYEGVNPPDQTFNITNTGGGTLNWSLSDGAAWLSESPLSGALVGNGAKGTVTVSVNASGLTVAGSPYAGVINVTDPGASNSPQKVNVSLEVKPATYIPSMRELPGDASECNQTYPGDTFNVYVNFTSSADGLNSIGLTDVAPAGWTVQVDKTWCSPEAYAVQTWGNKVEVLWSGPYGVGQNFSAMYKVTVPVTAKPGINTWEVCPNMTKSWLEYYFGEDGPHKACISGEYQMMITVPGKVTGETRDVNAALLSDVDVALLKAGVGAVDTDASTPNYSNDAHTTGMYWEVSTKALYYDINMTGMIMLPANWIDLSTPEVLAAGKVFDFEGNYGLVPRACTMSYAMKSVNLWLFPPTGHPEWGIAEWKAMDSIHSWQFPS